MNNSHENLCNYNLFSFTILYLLVLCISLISDFTFSVLLICKLHLKNIELIDDKLVPYNYI